MQTTRPHAPLAALALAALGLAAAHPALAQTTYSGNDPSNGTTIPHANSDIAAAAFKNAITTTGTETFESFSRGSLNGGASSGSFSGAGYSATFTGLNAFVGNASDDDNILGYNTTAGGAKFLQLAPLSNIQTDVVFTFTAPVNSFGADFTGVGTASGTLNLLFNDGTSKSYTLTGNLNGGSQFFGFTDFGKSIASIDLRQTPTGGGIVDTYGLDDVRFGNAGPASTVPEPGTWAAFAFTGLGTAALLLRARRRQAA